MTDAERVRRYQRKERERLDPKTKQRRRAERERASAARTSAAVSVGEKRYGVIYVDPPWRHEPYSTGMDCAADNHYPTMTLAELKALPVPAAKNCLLWLWFPRAQITNAVRLAETWGFAIKTVGGSDKKKVGTGYWLRDNLEFYLLATKGRVPARALGKQVPALIRAPSGGHSEKPEIFRQRLAELYPNVPKLEMFARGDPIPGWDRVGNEA